MSGDNYLETYLSSLSVKGGGKVGRPRSDNPSPASERKTSVYFAGDTLAQVQATAARLDRSVSWVLSQSFKLAQAQLEGMSIEQE